MPQVAIIKRYDTHCYECGTGIDLGISNWIEVTEKEREERQQKKHGKELKKIAKTKEQRRRLFQQLKAEFEDE